MATNIRSGSKSGENAEMALRKGSEAESGVTLFRLVMLGDTGTGKSNIADRFVRNIYTDPHKSTLGVEFQTKTIVLKKGSRVRFEIWDTSGQERYNALAPMYYRNANAAIVVYDITNLESYERAQMWVAELQQNAFPDMIVMLVGNKIDLASRRVVDSLDAEVYAEDLYLSFAQVSAKTGVGIQRLFESLAQRLLNQLEFLSLSKPSISTQQPSTPPQVVKVGKVGNHSPGSGANISNNSSNNNNDGPKKGCRCG